MLKLLDLCCGVGGWSIGFAREGFHCTGIDIVDLGYPYNFIECDIRDFSTNEQYDVIVASPPCAEFSVAKKWGYGNQVEYQGLDLVYACFNIIHQIKPKFYILENVEGLAAFIDKPQHIIRYAKHPASKKAYLYGKFPVPGLFHSEINYNKHDTPLWAIKRDRGKIPYAVSRAFAKCIKEEAELGL